MVLASCTEDPRHIPGGTLGMINRNKTSAKTQKTLGASNLPVSQRRSTWSWRHVGCTDPTVTLTWIRSWKLNPWMQPEINMAKNTLKWGVVYIYSIRFVWWYLNLVLIGSLDQRGLGIYFDVALYNSITIREASVFLIVFSTACLIPPVVQWF